MAQKFIEENYYNSYINDFIKDYKDYMIMRLQIKSQLYYYKMRFQH